LKEDILSLKEWSLKWMLNFNVIIGNPRHTYFTDDQPLQVVSEHKDFGIIMDPSLNIHCQTTSATNKQIAY